MDRQVWGLLRVFAPCAQRVAGASRCSCAVQAAAVILAASSLRALGEMNKGDQVMKNFTKAALGALLVAGATVGTIAATTAPAEARVAIGIGIGGPGYYGGYYGRPCYYDPYYCGGGYYGYGGPGVYFGTGWGGWGHGYGGYRGGWGGYHGGGFHGG